MTISALIAKVGDDKCKVEPIDANIRNCRKAGKQARSHSIIELETSMVQPADLLEMNKSPYIGLIVWLPRDAVNEAIKK